MGILVHIKLSYFMIYIPFLFSSSPVPRTDDHPRPRRDIDTSKKSAPSDMLLVQSIQITDKFGFKQDKQESGDYYDGNETTFTANEEGHGFCVNAIGKYTFMATRI